MEYHYPLSDDWSTEEIVDAVNFFSAIEDAYEDSVNREKLLNAYQKFKQIVPSKSEEKTLFKTFEKASGYASFPVVKKARENNSKNITMHK